MKIKRLTPNKWALGSAKFIEKKVFEIIAKKGSCSIGLTGGKSAADLYSAWSRLPSFWKMKNVHFFWGDERCVSKFSRDSNFGMTMSTLFNRGVPSNCFLHPLKPRAHNISIVTATYGSRLREKLDILILGVGVDGHIASLFPRDRALKVNRRMITPVSVPFQSLKRASITPTVIKNAKNIFVLARGPEKLPCINAAMQNPKNYNDLPVCMALDAYFLVDQPIKHKNTIPSFKLQGNQ